MIVAVVPKVWDPKVAIVVDVPNVGVPTTVDIRIRTPVYGECNSCYCGHMPHFMACSRFCRVARLVRTKTVQSKSSRFPNDDHLLRNTLWTFGLGAAYLGLSFRTEHRSREYLRAVAVESRPMIRDTLGNRDLFNTFCDRDHVLSALTLQGLQGALASSSLWGPRLHPQGLGLRSQSF